MEVLLFGKIAFERPTCGRTRPSKQNIGGILGRMRTSHRIQVNLLLFREAVIVAFNDVRTRARFISRCKEFSHFHKGTRFIPQASLSQKLNTLKEYKTYLQTIVGPRAKYLNIPGHSAALKLICEDRRVFVSRLKRFLLVNYVYIFAHVLRMSTAQVTAARKELLEVQALPIPYTNEVEFFLI